MEIGLNHSAHLAKSSSLKAAEAKPSSKASKEMSSGDWKKSYQVLTKHSQSSGKYPSLQTLWSNNKETWEWRFLIHLLVMRTTMKSDLHHLLSHLSEERDKESGAGAWQRIYVGRKKERAERKQGEKASGKGEKWGMRKIRCRKVKLDVSDLLEAGKRVPANGWVRSGSGGQAG